MEVALTSLPQSALVAGSTAPDILEAILKQVPNAFRPSSKMLAALVTTSCLTAVNLIYGLLPVASGANKISAYRSPFAHQHCSALALRGSRCQVQSPLVKT